LYKKADIIRKLGVVPTRRLTNGNCSPPCSGGSGSVRLGRLKAPTPHSTTFCQPWSLLRKALIRAGKTSYT